MSSLETDAERLEHAELGVVMRAQGMEFLRELTLVEWITVGRLLGTRHGGTAWSVGDWLNHGGGRNLAGGPRNGALGSAFADAEKITGLAREYLRSCSQQSSQWPLDSRWPDLSWTHHRIAARLLPTLRSDAMKVMVAKKMVVADARAYIDKMEADGKRATYRNIGPSPRAVEQSGYTHAEVVCPQCHHQFRIKGNKAPKEKKK